MINDKSDVVIAGGGLTGYVLALQLAHGGISSTIIEQGATTKPGDEEKSDPRALAITPGTKAILSRINVWQGLSPDKTGNFEKIHIWDEAGNGEVLFDCREVCSPVLGYIIEQSVLQDALAISAQGIAGIQVITGNTINSYKVVAGNVVCELTDGRIIEASLLVGADGARSRVRDLAGLAVERIDYHQKAVACIVETQLPHENVARQKFLKDGPVAFLPMQNPNQCGVVWSTATEAADLLLSLDDQEFCQRLGETFDYRLGNVLSCVSRAGFKLQRSRAQHYINGPCVLVGDAAHTVHPLAGQGANMGITDAAALSELIIGARSSGNDFATRQLLRKYERWRKTENNKMTMILEGLKNIFEHKGELIAFARGNGMSLVNRAPFIKNIIMKYAMGLSGDVPSIVTSAQIEEFSNAG